MATTDVSVHDPKDIDPEVRELEKDSPLDSIPSESEDASSSPSHFEIISIPADYTLEGLYAKWKRGQLKIPGFQRKYVWTQKQASRLIESFLLGLPVPALFLYTDPDTGDHQVIDGQQRLMSVIRFFEGTFENGATAATRPFKLVGLDDRSEYAGCTYEDLRDRHRPFYSKLNDAVMRAIIIRQIDPSDSTSIYHIFERLNTGGTRLLGQEIRNCVYHGALNDLIGEMNAVPDWRRILGTARPDARLRDAEMILRFVAMYFFSEKYRKPMKDFLSETMRSKRNLSKSEAESLRIDFERTCRIVVERLGEKPFHRRGGMNPPVFDAAFTAIAKHLDALPDDLDVRFRSLMKSQEFVNNSSYRTTDAEEVKERLRLAESFLIGAE